MTAPLRCPPLWLRNFEIESENVDRRENTRHVGNTSVDAGRVGSKGVIFGFLGMCVCDVSRMFW